MRIIGVVGRVYYNKDMQHVMQINEAVRRVLAKYEDVVVIGLLPMDKKDYLKIKMGEDLIDEEQRRKLEFILEKCDAFVVPGGTYWYNFDEYVIGHAIKYNKPLLGICAGFQALCSMFATNRNRFDMTKRFLDEKHYGKSNGYKHKNYLLENSKLKEIIEKDCFWVNSIHHDYVDFDMKDGLRVSCYSEDGVIEGVELVDKNFIVGIQWHPEYLWDEDSGKIFDRFIKCIK